MGGGWRRLARAPGGATAGAVLRAGRLPPGRGNEKPPAVATGRPVGAPSTPDRAGHGTEVDAPRTAGALVFGLGDDPPRAGGDRSGRPGQRPGSSTPGEGGR
eukprot:5874790-Alexandrium_andersonii.AAC.1